MDINTLLVEINKKLDLLLRRQGITQDSENRLIESGVGKATYSQENVAILEKYKEQTR